MRLELNIADKKYSNNLNCIDMVHRVVQSEEVVVHALAASSLRCCDATGTAAFFMLL